MPAITRDDGKPQVPIGAFRVLVTGFGVCIFPSAGGTSNVGSVGLELRYFLTTAVRALWR